MVGFTGLIGDDNAGELLYSIVKTSGIDPKGLKITNLAGTSSVVILINSQGERTFYYYGGANELLSYSDIKDEDLNNVSIVYVGGTFTLPKLDGEGTARIFSKAQSRGILTTLDATSDPTNTWLPVIEETLPYVDYFLPSLGEAKHIAGSENPSDIAKFLQEKGVGTVVVKLGERGCYVKHQKDPGFYTKSYKTNVVDTTGAGDAFVAGFLSGILRNKNIHECSIIATAVAALSIGKVGATAGQPTLDELTMFLNSKGE